ncbi:MAG: hypothetical protein IRZ32_03330 [Solirubrobacteraceae bacterium]|nr:hypothetical protein [Solirubrobacteraceae bacterium]
MTEHARRDAHAFLLALSDAIGVVADAHDDAAFAYRGADLRAAMERALFVGLSNDPQLREAFAGGAAIRLSTPLEAQTARAVLGRERVRGPQGLRLARLRWAERRAASAAAGSAAPRRSSVETGGNWFLLDHAKFLALADPVAGAWGDRRARVIWAARRLRPPHRADDPALDELAAPSPSPRVAGPALCGHLGLLREYERVAAALELARPERLVVVEGNSPYDGLAAAEARRLGIPIVCVQNGWSPIVHAGFRRMPFDRMCVWGDGFAELLAPHNPGLELVATGHPALRVPDGERDGELARRLEGRPAVACYLQPTSPYIEPRHADALLALVDEVAESAPDAAVIVRQHPGHPVGDRAWPANVVRADAPDVPLLDTILAARAVTSIYSTSLIEAAALGRPAVSLNPTALPRLSPDIEAEGAGIEVTEIEPARDALVEMLRSDLAVARFADGTARIRERYFSGLPADAPERVAAAIATA